MTAAWLVAVACGGENDSAGVDRPDVSGDPAIVGGDDTSERTTTTPSTTSPTGPGEAEEPVLVVCGWDGLQLRHVGLTSGEVVHESPKHPDAPAALEGLVFDGEQVGGPWMGLGVILCGAPARTLWSEDFSLAVGIAGYDDGTQVPVYVDVESPDLMVSQVVDAGPLQDFGPDRPVALVASFTPDHRGVFWRESQGGQCASYLVPDAVATDHFITRDEVAAHLIGKGGSCYGTDMEVRWAGDAPLVCTSSFGCDDANGNEVSEVPAREAGPDGTGPVSHSSLPPSERYLTGHPLYPAAYQVSEVGRTYFIGEDTTTDRSVLFSWAGEGAQPEEVLDLGPGDFSIVGYLPPSG